MDHCPCYNAAEMRSPAAAQATKLCPRCGTAAPAASRRCPSCGLRPKLSSSPIFRAAVVAVCLLGGSLVVAYLLAPKATVTLSESYGSTEFYLRNDSNSPLQDIRVYAVVLTPVASHGFETGNTSSTRLLAVSVDRSFNDRLAPGQETRYLFQALRHEDIKDVEVRCLYRGHREEALVRVRVVPGYRPSN